jgi:thioredoxin-like negative regulator of GroEL
LEKAKEAFELSKGKNIDIALNYAETLLANNNTDEAQRILSNITGISAAQIEKKIKLSN